MPQLSRAYSQLRQLAVTVIFVVMASIGLFVYGAWQTRSLAYSYLLWNLFLAILPLLFALRINRLLTYKRWSAWEPTAWTLLWLLFLPNSFYMVSDYIHLQTIGADRILYDAVMFTSFIFLGALFGFSSLYLLHHELRRRVRPWMAAGCIAVVVVICSFAIYIGRDLRWNSWDVITNPGGLLFDLSDRLLKPEAYPDMLLTTVSFSVLLGSLYSLIWRLGRLLRQTGAREVASRLRQQQPALKKK